MKNQTAIWTAEDNLSNCEAAVVVARDSIEEARTPETLWAAQDELATCKVGVVVAQEKLEAERAF